MSNFHIPGRGAYIFENRFQNFPTVMLEYRGLRENLTKTKDGGFIFEGSLQGLDWCLNTMLNTILDLKDQPQ